MDNINTVVEVVYALPDYQHIFKVSLADFPQELNNKVTILDVIEKSQILEYYSEIDLNINKVGIFSAIKKLSDEVAPNDRIEIYRPLIVDPLEARRIRALKQKKICAV
jgi:putative ubiquitin-RnfH superfamily antitoxin RatB of RatAB toxin-antitoxin module